MTPVSSGGSVRAEKSHNKKEVYVRRHFNFNFFKTRSRNVTKLTSGSLNSIS